MSILRKQTRSKYTHIDNELLDAEGLSFRAKGIASFLLSKKDDWEIKIEYLMHVGKEGRQAVRTALQELAAYGFLMRDRELSDNGEIRTVTRIADYPAFINVGTVERRINGYEPQAKLTPDLPETDMSETRTSKKRTVRKRDVLVTTDKRTTGSMNNRRRKDYNDIPADKPRGSYQPDDYPNL
jgi:hypothetical protein